MKKGAEHLKIASRILEDDFISPEEVSKARGIIYPAFQRELLAGVIPQLEILRQCRDIGGVVVALPPSTRSLLGTRMFNRELFYSKKGGWYSNDNEKFSHREKMGTGWLTIGKEIPIVIDQRGSVRIATAVEVAWLVTTVFETRGVHLLQDTFVKTSSRDSAGEFVFVGMFGSQGLHIGGYREAFGFIPGRPLSLPTATPAFAQI